MRASSAGLTLASIYKAIRDAQSLAFIDQFNAEAIDATIWTDGGEVGGAFSRSPLQGSTIWQIQTGNVVDDDWYISAGGITKNRSYNPGEEGYTTITWEARLSLPSIVDISSLWGLFYAVQANYLEPNVHCVQFFADPAISGTFRARTFAAAEEETDTLVALDTDLHDFKIVWTLTSVLFYIDGVLVATHATQVPSRTCFTEVLLRTEDNATKYLYLDLVRIEVD